MGERPFGLPGASRQALCARLAVATGRDLAQACRDAYPRQVGYGLWFLAEFAIVASDLAEIIGTAIGLNLLFGIPLEIGVIITALDVFLVREWQGVTHHVMALEHGFAWNGVTYRSLSEIARAITGTRWNGPRFFGLKEAKP